MRLIGKRALVTGGARGIGKGIAKRFLEEGAQVILLDFRRDELMETGSQLSKIGAEIALLPCDLSDPEQITSSATEAWSRFGGVDILVNNAGIATREKFIDVSYPSWKQILAVNLDAMFLLSQLIAKEMIKQNTGGSIVNMASKNALAGSSYLAHYNASKGGVHLLTQSMAVELAPHHIRVNAVAPGFIDTPLDRELKRKGDTPLDLTARTPMRRLGTVKEVADAFLFLASEESSYITGITLVIDGGHLANASEF